MLVWLSFGWLAVIILAAVFANLLPIPSYSVPVGPPRQAPSWSVDTLLGTDSLGRSLLARCLYGARVSLVIGTVAGLCGFAIGTLAGLLAGYFRRFTDAVLTYVTDSLLAFPPLILLLALSSVLKPSLTTLLLGLTFLVIPAFVRLSRANTLVWTSREFVRAARNMGAGDLRIMSREILPNVLPVLAAYLPIVIASLIVAEGSLSFLGLGIPPPTPSWGGIISDGKDAIADAPHVVFMPALILFLTVFSLNQVGDNLRARFDRTASES
ncbi:ABC transporter permease [Dactylosporangium sp. NPDC005572]|uniref:ABC transporter permease n=1 Tax=Dactylosporangium sp. NPDC005572 TaxID=3156889 RepID=UPI0033A3ADCA